MESPFLSLHAAESRRIGRAFVAWLAGLVVLHALGGRLPVSRTPPSPAPNGLVHWRDASHDWLLVAEQASGELVVYDAGDGRPLHRLGSRQGLAEVDGLVQHGPWLFVLGHGRRDVHLLKLPQLRPVDLAIR